ncbi:hypothetical protein QQP08_022356 [Theobroma cacao]|nr:hypothetical protein QQP08_022356 [Theobroma cacao]
MFDSKIFYKAVGSCEVVGLREILKPKTLSPLHSATLTTLVYYCGEHPRRRRWPPLFTTTTADTVCGFG